LGVISNIKKIHSFEKFVTVYIFYFAGGLARRKTLNLKGQDF